MSCPIDHSESECSFKNQVPSDLEAESTGLPKARVQSSIPRTDDQNDSSAHWMYPSPQMFYNAMKRKGAEPRPEDMELVVNIHNIVNEQCWMEVLKWESMHPECKMPKLYRFLGRPDSLSPKAWFKHWVLGYRKPFDRHDWYIDRCGEKVRYVIDFYGGSDAQSPIAFHLDVRPALDGWSGLKDRLRRMFD